MTNMKKLIRRIDETCNGLNIDKLPDGTLKPLKINGVRGRISSINSPFLNIVGLADLEEERCNDVIRLVIDRYKRENKNFGWLVGPTTKPNNIDKHLIENGFKKVQELSTSGMLLNDMKINIGVNDDFIVRRVEGSDFEGNISLITKSFGMGLTEEEARMVIALYKSQGENSYLYFAFEKYYGKPVAFAASVMEPDNELVILLGAGTLPEYRGKGIYSSLVGKRLNDASEAGAKNAIIQAVKHTSAPICERLGFKTVCEIDFYIYNS
jgi:GNAT superfamily N-acetyltransferase